jgi:hypothetical protein
MKAFSILLLTLVLTACSSAPKKTEMDVQLDHLERLSTIAKSLQPATQAPIIINNPPAPVINNFAPQSSSAAPIPTQQVIYRNRMEPPLIPGSYEDQMERANYRRSHYDMLRPEYNN